MASGALFDVCIPNGRCAAGTARIFANASWKQIVAPHSVCKYVSYFFIWTILNLHHVHGAVAISCSICADSWPLPSIPIHSYPFLRYVARAVLDPKRSQLLITGCTWFGAPRSTEEVIFLDQLRPGHALEGGFIKFRSPAPALLQQCLQISWGTKWVWFDWLVLWDIWYIYII